MILKNISINWKTDFLDYGDGDGDDDSDDDGSNASDNDNMMILCTQQVVLV